MRSGATSDDRWLRRTAVICQLGAKERTDVALLTAAIEANLDDAEWVRSFVAEQSDRLSPLSRREALRHLNG